MSMLQYSACHERFGRQQRIVPRLVSQLCQNKVWPCVTKHTLQNSRSSAAGSQMGRFGSVTCTGTFVMQILVLNLTVLVFVVLLLLLIISRFEKPSIITLIVWHYFHDVAYQKSQSMMHLNLSELCTKYCYLFFWTQCRYVSSLISKLWDMAETVNSQVYFSWDHWWLSEEYSVNTASVVQKKSLTYRWTCPRLWLGSVWR